MTTPEDYWRMIVPELEGKTIQDSHISHLIIDCIQGIIPEYNRGYMAVFGLLVWYFI